MNANEYSLFLFYSRFGDIVTSLVFVLDFRFFKLTSNAPSFDLECCPDACIQALVSSRVAPATLHVLCLSVVASYSAPGYKLQVMVCRLVFFPF